MGTGCAIRFSGSGSRKAIDTDWRKLMRPTLSLIKREFTAYFYSPIAYVVLAVFLLVTGHLFYLTLNLLTETGPRGVEYPMQTMLGDERFWLVFLFIPPLLTMRLFAEERGTGTLEMLMTAPIRDWQVVLSKFIACFIFYMLMWLPTLAYVPVLVNLDWNIFAWQWTPMSKVLVISLGVALCYVVLNSAPFGPLLRFILQFLIGMGPFVLYLLYFQTYSIPQIGSLDYQNQWVLLSARVGILLVIFIAVYIVPIIIARLSGESYDGAVLFSGWVQFLLSFFLVGLHLLRVNEEGIFRPITLTVGLDARPVFLSYAGAILAGGMFLAMGLFVSSLTRSQMVAALISLILSLLFIVGGFWRPELDQSSLTYRLIQYVSVPLHFREDFTRGIVNIGHIVLYISATLFFLFLTVRSLESRRWK
jgi:ABC-type transport system involved in multi-copper enzyme maturation permease subunit